MTQNVSALLAPVRIPTERDFVEVIDHYLCPEACARLYDELRVHEIPSSLFYVSRADLDSGVSRLAEYLPAWTAELVTLHLRQILDGCPKALACEADGFEIWTTHSTRSDHNGCYVHIDNDEELRKRNGTVRAPRVGSILHVGPTAGLVGGETMFASPDVFCQEFMPFRFHDWDQVIGHPASRVVAQSAGRLVVFDGHLAHGRAPVRDHLQDQPRVTLLANLWDERIGDVPEGICPLTPEAYHRRFPPRAIES